MSGKSPIIVQQWLDTLPNANTSSPPSRSHSICGSPARFTRGIFTRDMSIQSDDGSSHCSSVESVLELRRPDPEAVLLGLGFGPPRSANSTTRIPQRFLQPSKLIKDIDIQKFIQQQGDQYLNQKSTTTSSPARPHKNHTR